MLSDNNNYWYDYDFVSVEFPDNLMMDLIIKLAQIEKQTAAGCSEAVQLNALVSAFQNVRDIEKVWGARCRRVPWQVLSTRRCSEYKKFTIKQSSRRTEFRNVS